MWKNGSLVKSQMNSLISNIANLKKNGLKGTITSNTAASLQLVEFAYMIALLYDKSIATACIEIILSAWIKSEHLK